MTNLISRDELLLRLERGAPLTLVEVLGYDWWADAHLPGALNLPTSRIALLAPAALPDRHEPVVVYASRTCCEASEAAAVLEALGYSEVRVYADGKEDWIEAGLPVERA